MRDDMDSETLALDLGPSLSRASLVLRSALSRLEYAYASGMCAPELILACMTPGENGALRHLCKMARCTLDIQPNRSARPFPIDWHGLRVWFLYDGAGQLWLMSADHKRQLLHVLDAWA